MHSLLTILLATTLTLAVIVPQIESTISGDDDDSCHSYAGGSVYPQGDGRADHKLQYTKAVSKFFVIHEIFTRN